MQGKVLIFNSYNLMMNIKSYKYKKMGNVDYIDNNLINCISNI